MTEISDSLRLLYETTLEEREDEYVLTLPKGLVEDSSLANDNSYRVALLESASDSRQSKSDRSETTPQVTEPTDEQRIESQGPPVEVGDVRSVTIDTLGDQGDGIAKVERGFIVIVPDTRPGDRVDVEITNVADSVAFAEPVSKAEVR
ncbi:TRAM domain-containing protein [Haloparvum sp. PAK95]|uniref:TRAM domain-containing protein n=1 Tax=Haloparvum sp. PAK95 TaxID=3418962 RepID=UPI003D2EED85